MDKLQHIAIIMDGNGRWAKKRALPRTAGHTQGARVLESIVKHAASIGLRYVTVYAFSTENWARPASEVKHLMKLLTDYVSNLDRFSAMGVKLRIIGDLTNIDERLREKIELAVEKSSKNTGLTLVIAFNYGSRSEILHATRLIAEEAASGKLSPKDITEEHIRQRLYTHDIPDPDFILRPSGEMRLSNFLLWQASYSELIFIDKLWPDFTTKDLDSAILEFSKRRRRFGGI